MPIEAPIKSGLLDSISDVLSEQLTGQEISRFLAEVGISDVSPDFSKKKDIQCIG